MTTKTLTGHRAGSAARPAVIAQSAGAPSTGVVRLRRDDFGGALVRRGAYGAPTPLPGDRTPAPRRVLTS